jgi:hypothetical protein
MIGELYQLNLAKLNRRPARCGDMYVRTRIGERCFIGARSLTGD